MEVGAIGFHRESAREYRTVSRDRDILKRLGKTKREEYPDLNALRLERDDEERRAKRAANKRQKEEVSVAPVHLATCARLTPSYRQSAWRPKGNKRKSCSRMTAFSMTISAISAAEVLWVEVGAARRLMLPRHESSRMISCDRESLRGYKMQMLMCTISRRFQWLSIRMKGCDAVVTFVLRAHMAMLAGGDCDRLRNRCSPTAAVK